MKTNIILLAFISVFIFGVTWNANAQLNSNNAITPYIPNENPFLDASSNFDLLVDPSSNGKGLAFPRTDLTQWVFRTNNMDGVFFPSAFDGMIVYNSGTGNTPTTGNNPTTSTVVRPGFYMFSNPNGYFALTINSGKWVRLNDNNVTSLPNGGSLPAIAAGNPVTGDVFYKTGAASGLYVFDGSAWTVVTVTNTAGTGLTLTAGAFSVNTSQNISTLSNLTSNGLVKTSGGTGALSIASAGTDYQLPIALTTIGTSGAATFSSNTLNIPNYSYTLPNATASTLGGVIVGSGLNVNAGTISTVNNGSVTGFSADDLSPLFTTTEATTSTTPALSFTLTNAAANTIFGNNSASSAAPSYFLATALPVAGDVSGTLGASSVDKLKGKTLSITSLTTGDLLKYNGTNWVNATPASLGIASSIGSPIAATDANGMTLSSGVLALELADNTHPGIVSIAAQTFAGAKTFSSAPLLSTMTSGSVLFAGASGVVSQDNSNFYFDATNHRLGIGTTSPGSKLEVNGAATNKVAYSAGSGTSIDFTLSNLAYTTASPGAFTLTGLKDGGTYTLAVQGTTSGTASFTQSGLTFLSVNNNATTSGKQTLYTFIVMGTTVYFYMNPGF